MDRDLHDLRASNLGQGGLEPFGIAETPLVDMLFSITRPDTAATRKPAPLPSYLTERTASIKPRGALRHPLLRMQQPQHRSRGG